VVRFMLNLLDDIKISHNELTVNTPGPRKLHGDVITYNND